MTNFICPLCDKPLQISGDQRGLSCSNNHQFDRAKQGYFNLLPVQRKKSKQPGDSKEMIVARHNFLAANYYQPLAQKIAEIVEQQAITKRANDHESTSFSMLDIGCGEGYYSRQIKQQISDIEQFGIDISKPAVMMAAKADKSGHYVVASSDRLPLADSCIDLALKVYAPANDGELQRVLTCDGTLLTITPAARHLWQLREFIYQQVREHDTQDTEFAGFKLSESQRLSYQITPSATDRIALLQMTPFAWRANEEVTAQIAAANDLAIELDFIINLYRPIPKLIGNA